ncbi:sialate O-acetylesterase [Kineococcus sp. SYSU DK001]|uniref:sialate O-acetylesterase n=1 Tax=Kineococcus sp. SYSU DK001 TaxID=3383122 RepID=UPI003D7DAB28
MRGTAPGLGAEEDAGEGGSDLVVVLGQSNASGTNTDVEPDGLDRRDARIRTFGASGPDAGRVVPAREPLAPLRGHPPGGMGPGGPFASLLLPTLPAHRDVLVVPAAVGGTGFRTHGSFPGVWAVGLHPPGVPNLLDLAVAHVRAALRAAGPGSRVAAVLWQQGETDGGQERGEAEYAADLDELIAAFRAQVPTAAAAPFTVGGLPAERLAAYPGHAGVQAALEATPARVPRTGFAPAPPPGHVNDVTTHLTAAGQRILGANHLAASRSALRAPGGGDGAGQQAAVGQPPRDQGRHRAGAVD